MKVPLLDEPVWWVNFLNTIADINYDLSDWDKQMLEEGIISWEEDGSRFLMFPSEQDFIAFVLRWS